MREVENGNRRTRKHEGKGADNSNGHKPIGYFFMPLFAAQSLLPACGAIIFGRL
jgi:hypothetical protein